MADKSASLIFACALLLCSAKFAASQDAAMPKDAAPADPVAATDIGPVPPVVTPLPLGAAAISVQCAVPQSEVARPSPLVNTTARIESNKPVRVLAMGSAATWSAGRSPATRSYPSRLESILENVWKGVDIKILNRGVSGEIASVSARRLINEAAMQRPSLVLWQLGTSDAVARVPVEDFEATVRSTVRMLRDNKIDVILVGLQYTPKFARDSQYFAIRGALEKIATEENLLYVRRYQAMEFIARTRANSNMLADDDFNLADVGYPCMADHIAQAVVANIFLRHGKPSAQQPSAPPRSN